MAQPEAGPHFVAGKALRCHVCEHDRFHHRQALLTRRGAAFFDIEWLWRPAQIYACERCGFLHWFKPPKKD
jgi:hypothetical protein